MRILDFNLLMECQTIIRNGKEVSNHSVYLSKDTRTINKGDWYVAIPGEQFDGKTFIEEALSKGAKGVIFEGDYNFQHDLPFLKVSSIQDFLFEVAGLVLDQWRKKNENGPVVCITGSSGKTTVKEILGHILDEVFVTEGNYNNNIGAPFTIQNIRTDHKKIILEIGTSSPGEIAYLCKMIKPSIGYITNISLSHLDLLKNREGVFNEKRALYDFIVENEGAFLINSDDDKLASLEDGPQTYSVGFSGKYLKFENNDGVLSINGDLNFKPHPLVIGDYNFHNLLSAISIGFLLGENCKELSKKAESFLPGLGRSSWITHGEKTVFFDAYNANPLSMKGALKAYKDFIERNNERCLCVIGDMNELGEKSSDYHRELGEYASELFKDAQGFIYVGMRSEEFKEGFKKKVTVYKNIDELVEHEDILLRTESHIFMKASRGVGLEKALPKELRPI